jgi:hypothetical protein
LEKGSRMRRRVMMLLREAGMIAAVCVGARCARVVRAILYGEALPLV